MLKVFLSWPCENTLGSRIEVPVRLFFFGFFPRPVRLIWVYVFNSFSKKSFACVLIWDMCAYQRQFFQNFARCIQQQSTKKPINNDFFSHYKFWSKYDTYMNLLNMEQLQPFSKGSYNSKTSWTKFYSTLIFLLSSLFLSMELMNAQNNIMKICGKYLSSYTNEISSTYIKSTKLNGFDFVKPNCAQKAVAAARPTLPFITLQL